jgi:hypothetical protein
MSTKTGGPAFDGGAAFPQQQIYRDEDGKPWFEGMTLRDYFAAKAMQALISIDGGTLEKDAEAAYKMANAMLKAREQ